MSNRTYNELWERAMYDLEDQLYIENPNQDLPVDNGKQLKPKQYNVAQSYQQWSLLYVKYCKICKSLSLSHDGCVHPQKRILIKRVLQMVINRIISLYHLLVKWNPPFPVLGVGIVPNEFVTFDDVLMDLKLDPSVLSIKVPNYFVNELEHLKERNKLINGYYEMHHGNPPPRLANTIEGHIIKLNPMDTDVALEIIQRNERGRQGYERTCSIQRKINRDNDVEQFSKNKADADNIDQYIYIQSYFRSYRVRKILKKQQEIEMKFIKMNHSDMGTHLELMKNEEIEESKRRTLQVLHEEELKADLDTLHKELLNDEGHEMKTTMLMERRLWYLSQLKDNKIPEDLTEFYTPPPPPPPPDDKKKAPPKAPPKQSKKQVEEVKEMPPSFGNDKIIGDISENIKSFTDIKEKIESFRLSNQEKDSSEIKNNLAYDNFEEKYDKGLALIKIRPDVTEEVRSQVDNLMLMQLENLKKQMAKKKKGGKKKGKGKAKKPPVKKLPGTKFCKNMDKDQMLSELVEKKLIYEYNHHKKSDYIYSYSYTGSIYQRNIVIDRFQKPVFPEVQPGMIDTIISNYCILPMGDSGIREKIDPSINVKTILFYGPSGGGKTFMTEIIATEIGAMVIDITITKLYDLYPGKNGPIKALHVIFETARDPERGPTILYMENVDVLFGSGKGKKKREKTIEGKIKKNLVKYLSSLDPNERVLLIGTCNTTKDIKSLAPLKKIFQKAIYFPYPDYNNLVRLWTYFIERKIGNHLPIYFSVSNLAKITYGYTAGSIEYTVENTLTPRRLETINNRELKEEEFINILCSFPVTYKENHAEFYDFYVKFNGFNEAMIAEEARKAEEAKKRK